ncbi:type III PLP-dependent enzyme [archaeon]|nr:MAG: type III PLP-dependent enzyme [archaeon]
MEEGYNDRLRYSTEVSSLNFLTDPKFKHDEQCGFPTASKSTPTGATTAEASGFSDTCSSDGETCESVLSSASPSHKEHVMSPNLDELVTHDVGTSVFDLSDFGSVPQFINYRIENKLESGSFLVTNLASVVRQYNQWRDELPMVEPFYAVKCNPDPCILRLMASLGLNFDCATMGEIDLVLHGLGEELSFPVSKAARSIVYANPAKMQHMIEYAVHHGVRMTVFDGEDELEKIATTVGHEHLQLLLRLTTDDKASVCQFSKKFGCPVDDAPNLLAVAKRLNLNVAGVSFHVGSGCGDADAYVTALAHAKRVFDAAEALGMPALHIVDLGGGFPGDTGGYGGPGMPTFQDIARAIRKGIDSFLAGYPHAKESLRFIAEPGRYFVSASTTIVTKVYSRKGGQNKYQALYVDDGVYGSFNNVVYDHANPVPQKLSSVLQPKDEELLPSAVFGPTCDGLDQMCKQDSTTLPRCEVGDWLIWENQGAYTHTASFVFNGYTHVPTKCYCYL